jgi:hypothetical protein
MGMKSRKQSIRALLCTAVFVAALFLRSPMLFIHPRFWAEEGPAYYAALQGGTLFDALTLVVRGNFQLLTNLSVYLATWAPAVWAPAVTTYLALAMSMALAALVGTFSAQHGWSLPKALAVTAALALLPHGYEVYLTSTNVQWICGAALLVVSVIDVSGWDQRGRSVLYAGAVMCGLTGIPSVVVAPAFLARRFVAPSPVHFHIGLALAVCGAIQVAVLLTHAHPDRPLGVNGYAIASSLLLQTVLSPVLTVDVAETIARPLRAGVSAPRALFGLAGGALLVWYAATSAIRAARVALVPATLFALWLGVTVVQVVGALGDPMGLVSGGSGARYFLAGTLCFLLMLALADKSRLAGAVITVVLFSGAYQVVADPPWRQYMTNGPSWTQEVERCRHALPCAVMVWPSSPASLLQLTSF